jgi:hypothetical protein
MITPKLLNIGGLIVWTILFFSLVSIKLLKEYPLIILGYIYTSIIIITNYLFIGSDKSEDSATDFHDTKYIIEIINSKAIEVSTATFAIAFATKDMFKTTIYRHLLSFMMYTLIFGVGIISPIYFISDVSKDKLTKYNEILLRLRNVSLSYAIGFMMCTYMLIINRLYDLYKN